MRSKGRDISHSTWSNKVYMNLMEKLNKLIELCKYSVHLTINGHRDYYKTAGQYFNKNPEEDIEPDVYEKMKELDTIIELQYYPDTPVGFYKIYHYDLERAIDEALSSLSGSKNEEAVKLLSEE